MHVHRSEAFAMPQATAYGDLVELNSRNLRTELVLRDNHEFLGLVGSNCQPRLETFQPTTGQAILSSAGSYDLKANATILALYKCSWCTPYFDAHSLKCVAPEPA
jgi:hypothetical protein